MPRSHKQDQAGDEIVDDALQAETDADRQRAGDEGEFLQIEPERRAADQQGDDDADIAEDRPHRVLHARVEPGVRQKALAEPVLRGARRDHADDEAGRPRQQRRQRDRHAADGESEIGRAQR